MLSAEVMNRDLIKISKWANQWKMYFNPDITKQEQEVIFSRKSKKTDHPTVYFSQAPIAHTNCHKHLAMFLEEKLNFLQQGKTSKANRGIEAIRKVRHILPKHSVVTIYNSFDKPHLHYCDIIYDQPNNESFWNKIESFQYNAAFEITGAIRATLQTKLYNEFGLKSLKFRTWMRRLCMFYKTKILKTPEYLHYLIPND